MLLESLEVHHLWFTGTARTPVHFGPQAGAQLRGALWKPLKASINNTALLEAFMLLETPDAARGQNPARPFSIQPPLANDPGADRYYQPGETFQFGVSLFGMMVDLFPYIVQAVHRIGQTGVGYHRRDQGRFDLTAVTAANPLTGATQVLLVNDRITSLPSIPVTAQQVEVYAQSRSHFEVTLHFITPTQLTGPNKTLLSSPEFDHLMSRLIERCQSVAENYTSVATPRDVWRKLHLDLNQQAGKVTMSVCDARWVNVRSGSRRSDTSKKISGFTGVTTFTGPLEPFLPWLVWGQSLQVGKNTVKGSGWYAIA